MDSVLESEQQQWRSCNSRDLRVEEPMLSTMVAGPTPTAYCENGVRTHNQVLDVPPHGHPINSPRIGRQLTSSPPPQQPPNSNSTTQQPSPVPLSAYVSSTTITPSSPSVSSTCTSKSRSTPTSVNNMVTISPPVAPDGIPQPEYTPPPMSAPGPMSQPQGPPPPYCPQEYIHGDPYYPGPPPEYCQHHPHMCALQHHGIPGKQVLKPSTKFNL